VQVPQELKERQDIQVLKEPQEVEEPQELKERQDIQEHKEPEE
jgi:hypothetical protein